MTVVLNEGELDSLTEIFPQMEKILQCGVYRVYGNPSTLSWSRGLFQLLGLDAAVTTPSFDLLYSFVIKEQRDELIRAVEACHSNHTRFQMEFSIVNHEGIFKRIYAESSEPREHESLEYAVIFKDVTENYFFKRSLEQKVQLLDKSNQGLQEFVYVASHDLQEPLRKISTFSGRLEARFGQNLNDEGRSYLERILKSTRNMQQLLEDLLSFSRLSFTRMDFEDVDLKEVLDQTLSDLEVTIEETRTTVVMSQLPTIQGYPTQIRQLFNNLLSNAIKFRKKGHFPYIRIHCEPFSMQAATEMGLQGSDSYYKLTFEDNGIGFEPEYKEKIFMIFQRLNGKAEYSGSGVGLSICKRIVENHHGLISAEGKPDQGAAFTIILPEKQPRYDS